VDSEKVLPTVDRRIAGGFVVALLALAAPAIAADEAEPDLRALEARALAETPALAAARERLAAAEAAAPGAGLLPDPSFELLLMDVVPTGGRPADLRPTVRQPLPGRGKRGAERDVAAAEIDVARAELALAERRAVADLRTAFGDYWKLARERALLDEAHGAMELMLAAADARLGGGVGSVGESLAARRGVRRHELLQEDVDGRWLQAMSRLAEAAGGGRPFVAPHVPELGDEALPTVEIEATLASDPEVALAGQRVALAETRLAAARLGLRVDWSIFGGTRTMSGDGTELVAGFGVELPFFRRRRVEPQIAAAEHQLAAARADVEATRVKARGELERLLAERARLAALERRTREGLLPETVASFEAERAALADGSGSVERAASLLEESVNVRIELETYRAERFAVRAALLAHLPADPEPAGGVE